MVFIQPDKVSALQGARRGDLPSYFMPGGLVGCGIGAGLWGATGAPHIAPDQPPRADKNTVPGIDAVDGQVISPVQINNLCPAAGQQLAKPGVFL